ncbi:MAG: hypothetical protein ABIZ70_07225 [Gemmatimonadales bacterium]
MANFDCPGVPGDSIEAASKRFRAAVVAALGDAAMMSGWLIRHYLGSVEFCDVTVTRTYYGTTLHSTTLEWHLNTCQTVDYYWDEIIDLGDGDPPPGNGSGGVAQIDSIIRKEMEDSAAVVEPSCFVVIQNVARPGECLKKFKKNRLDMLRATAGYARPLSEIADTVARRQCAEIRGWFDEMMATDTLLYAGQYDSPTGFFDSDGNPRLDHFSITWYPNEDPAIYGKAHIDPYWIKYLDRMKGTTEAPKSYRATLRFLMHESIHVMMHLRHPEVTNEFHAAYTSPYFETIESRDPNKSCILPGTDPL